MGLLDGHKAVVTGGASGIGRATCRRMAAEGATVAVVDIDAGGTRAIADEIGGSAHPADVTDQLALEAAIRDAANRMGGLTLMSNNAGGGGMGRVHERTVADWDAQIRLNLGGVFGAVKAGVPLMLDSGGGAIVNTASISGLRPAAGESPYAAAKAAVVALTASAALEYAPTIRLNAVSPGAIDTALTAPLLEGLPAAERWWAAKTPLGRVGDPDDVAGVIVFLCSDLARYMTGQNLVVDGGMTLHGSGVDGLMIRLEEVAAGGEFRTDV